MNCKTQQCVNSMGNGLLVEMAGIFSLHRYITTTVISCMGVSSFSQWGWRLSATLIDHFPAASVTQKKEHVPQIFCKKTHFLLLSTRANYKEP